MDRTLVSRKACRHHFLTSFKPWQPQPCVKAGPLVLEAHPYLHASVLQLSSLAALRQGQGAQVAASKGRCMVGMSLHHQPPVNSSHQHQS